MYNNRLNLIYARLIVSLDHLYDQYNMTDLCILKYTHKMVTCFFNYFYNQ
jgi:hypothetical protein